MLRSFVARREHELIPHQPKTCLVCGCALTVHQSVAGLCDRADCRAAAIRQLTVKKEEERQAAMRAVAVRWLSTLPGSRAHDYELLVLPGKEASLETNPPSQRNALREHLMTLLAQAHAESAAEVGRAGEFDAAPRPGLAAACAACRGYCCRAGGSRAFLDAPSIARVREQQPHWDDEAIIAAYLDAVPDQRGVDSCIFHGDRGCTLPRDLRSQTCNEFYCRPLRNWIVSAPQMRPGATAVAVVVNGEVARSAFIEDVDESLT
jgi:hypothetical protein